MRGQHACRSGKMALEAVLFLGFWLLLARPAHGQKVLDLQGRVRTDKGQAIPMGVTVRLETAEGRLVAEQPANSNGDFNFPSVRAIQYVVTVTAEGFQPFQKEIDLSERANVYFLDVYLSAANKRKLPAQDLPSLTDANAPKKARRELEKGTQALASKSLHEAQAHLEKAVELYPCYARAQVLLAPILSAQHDAPGAEAALEKAIQCDPGFLDAYVELGQLLNAEKKFTDSERVLSEGLRHSPNAWQFHYQLAASYFGLGQYAKAEEAYRKVQSLNPSPPPELHVKLADLYLKTNTYDKAYAQMQEYLRSEPDGRFAGKVKEIMGQMESSGVMRPAQAEISQPPK
jgi:tetratricopeptide (TPR) repeat protein